MSECVPTTGSGGSCPPCEPGSLELVVRFVNTAVLYEGGEVRDAVADPASLRDWLQAQGLTGADVRVSAADHARACELREALRALLFAKVQGQDEQAAADVLTRVAGEARLALRFTADARASLEPAAPGVSAALGHLVSLVWESMVDGRWERLKACQNECCRYAFFDQSKNRSRTWCAMSPCGNRLKARARRQRLAEERDRTGCS